MMQEINKIGLITGASSGIGYALAKALAKENFKLVITARRSEKLKELEDKKMITAHGKTIVVFGTR